MTSRFREADSSVAQRRLASVSLWFVAMAGVVAMVGLVVGARSLLGSDDGEGQPADEPPEAVVEKPLDATTEEPLDPYRQPGWIEVENSKPGSLLWRIPEDRSIWRKVSGFADAVSIDREGTVTLYVTTAAPTFDVQALRIGWYGGKGARQVWVAHDVPSIIQDPPLMDPATGMAEAPWLPTREVDITRNWPPGAYIFRLSTADGGASYIPLVIRDDESEAPVLVQSSVTTWQAYNDWGGASLYSGRGPGTGGRANIVSFNRPYNEDGSGEFFGREFEFIYLAEQLGLDLTYWTDIDLHEQPEGVLRHNGLVSLGHDEFYTTIMRQGLETARDAGVNIAFLGANAVFRRIRLEDSALGPYRHEVNYRSAVTDPLAGIDDANVTTSFRDPPAANPESSLVGSFYECNPVQADMLIADADAWVFEGTGLQNGDILPGVVGNEYDRVTLERPTPGTIQVLAHTPLRCRGLPSFADMTYYTTLSGAGVFATGTLWWIRPHLLVNCRDQPRDRWECQVQRITENVLRAFAEGPAGLDHPSEPNLAELGIAPGYVSPAPG